MTNKVNVKKLLQLYAEQGYYLSRSEAETVGIHQGAARRAISTARLQGIPSFTEYKKLKQAEFESELLQAKEQFKEELGECVIE